MATGIPRTSHPHLRSPILYVADVPRWATWQHLVHAFKPCGTVTMGGKDTLSTNRGRRTRWKVHFSDILQAEMALATLQGTSVPGVNPTFTLELSYSPTLPKPAPWDPLLPQYVRYTAHEDEIHPLQQANVQDVFTWFRRAGPLVSVRVNEDVGWPYPTCIVQYWDYRHAQHARMNCRILHPALEGMPPFALRTVNPRNLYCSALSATTTQTSIQDAFSQFGEIIEIDVQRIGVPNSFVFVTFATEEQAAKAMKAMNGAMLDGQVITVRLHEPSNQDHFRPPTHFRQASSPETRPNQAKNAYAKEVPRHQEEAHAKAREDAEPATREEPLEEGRRDTAQSEAEGDEDEHCDFQNNIKRAAAIRAREQATREAEAAWNEMVNAAVEERTVKEELAGVEEAHDETKRRWHEADEAMKEAERAMEAARARRAEAAKDSVDVLRVKNATAERHRVAIACLDAAKEKEKRSRDSQEAAERKEQELLKNIAEEEARLQEEQRRQAELAESIRKLEEMREQEEAERRERIRREREKAEEERRREVERLAREEQERKEREEQERKRKEEERRAREELLEKKRQEERRLQAYREAALQEKARCRGRDEMLATLLGTARTPWTKEQAVTRFKIVSTEFDSLRFCDIQPLTFESIPWPSIHSPHLTTLDDIEWNTVEEFFEAAKLVVNDASEYRDMVEKAHRRFHPDKWRARGLLLTVLDEDLRKRLEEAGNVVAQAITPLWLASKSKK